MKRMIMLGVILNFAIALGHLLCLFDLDKIFAIYGISEVMDKFAAYGAYVPYIITVVIAVAFAAVAFYGLSALKKIPRLPLQTTAFAVICAVFFGRVVWGLTMLIPDFTWLELSSTGVSALLCICYLPYFAKKKQSR